MMDRAGGTHIAAKDVDLTNAELLLFLQEKVLPPQDKVLERLTSIDTHLATLNGSVARNARDIAASQAATFVISEEQRAHCIALAILKVRNAHHKERLGETRSDTKALIAKVWDNSLKISGAIASLAMLTKMANLW